MTKFPENWTQCKLDAICSVYQPKTISTKELIEDGRYAVYGANGEIGRYNKYNHTDSEVLITCRGATCGRINISRPFSWINGNAMVVHPCSNNLRKDFLYYYLTSINFAPYISGSAQPQITRISLQPLELSLPPLAEQGRIVQKIEELFADIDAGIQNLKSVQDQIKLYRQSVLKSAFDNDFEHLTLNDLCSVISDGDHQPPPKANEGVPFIVISNLHGNIIDLKETMFVKKDYFLSLPEKRKPRRNDVLYSVVGSYGIPALVDFDDEFCFQRHIALLRPDIKKLYPKFLFYVLQSRNVYNQATNCSTGTAQKTVPLSGLRSISIPVPTLDEQEHIVAEIEKRFERADELEQVVADALADAEKLKQSVLKKAFRGELVPQNPDDEPAAVLLDRIRAERAAAPKSPKKGKRK